MKTDYNTLTCAERISCLMATHPLTKRRDAVIYVAVHLSVTRRRAGWLLDAYGRDEGGRESFEDWAQRVVAGEKRQWVPDSLALED